jgi:tetratricopeptide (TPR) repeat protein
MNTPAILLLMSLIAAQPAAVIVPLDSLTPPPPRPEEAPVDVLVDLLDVTVAPGDETHLELTWTLTALEETWVDLAVVGAGLTLDHALLDGREVALAPAGDGQRHLVARLDGRHVLVVGGSMVTPRSQLDLPLMAAARTAVAIAGGGWDVDVEDAVTSGGHHFDLFGSDRLAATWRPAAPPAPRPRVITAEVATAIRIDEGGLQGRAALRYRIRHGSAEVLTFTLPSAAVDVQVEGPGIGGFQRTGDQVRVDLVQDIRGAVTMDVTWRAANPSGEADATAPVPLPQGSTGGWVTLMTADGSLVLPAPVRDLQPLASRSVPSWGRGLIDGTTHTAYRVSGTAPRLDYRLLRYTPVDEPPTLIDEARYEVAYTAHGRVLMRARYQVRNDRRQYLHVVPPPGFDPMGVRVAGDVVQPVSDGGEGLYVPLEKSIETLHGLVTFPVEITFWGKEEAWARRGTRQLVTPAVDAPVAYARWEVVLPPNVVARETHGVPTLVEQWTSRAGGLAYGHAAGAPGGALDHDEDDRSRDGARRQRVTRSSAPAGRDRDKRGAGNSVARWTSASDWEQDSSLLVDGVEEDEEEALWLEDLSQDSWNQAYRAYQDNRFAEADELLDQSLEYNPDNSAAVALQANVDVLLGQGQQDAGGEQVQSRRIREMAQARTTSMEVQQEKKKREAEEAMRSGDIDAAVSEYRALLELTEQLAVVEREESVDHKEAVQEFSRQLDDLERMSGERGRKDAGPQPPAEPVVITSAPSGAHVVVSGAISSGTTVIGFEYDLVEGELLLPPADRGESTGDGLDRYEDEDGEPDLDLLAGLNGAYSFDATDMPDQPIEPEPEMIMVATSESRPASRPRAPRIHLPTPSFGRGGGGRGKAQATELPPPPPTTPAATAPPPVGITAALQTVRIPRAGQVLRLEQRLVSEHTPLTIEVGFRTPERRKR